MEEMYFPEFSESFREEQSPVEEVDEIQVLIPKKKSNRRRQPALTKKPQNQKDKDQCCIPWTLEEDTALCNAYVRISEDSVVGNARKENGFWVEKHMHVICSIAKHRKYDMVNEKWKNVRTKVASFCGLYTNNFRTYSGGAAKRKEKARTSSTGSTNAFDGVSLAKLMGNEYAMASEPYNVQKGHEMTVLLRIKKQALELKAAELEI
nr:hypothetical protein [Tanacetum cinerariifolium]